MPTNGLCFPDPSWDTDDDDEVCVIFKSSIYGVVLVGIAPEYGTCAGCCYDTLGGGCLKLDGTETGLVPSCLGDNHTHTFKSMEVRS